MAAVTGKVVLLLCFVSLSPVTRAQSEELVCPSEDLVVVTPAGLVFVDFPPDYDVQSEVQYSPGGIGPWYNFAEGIIDIVRSGSVTQAVIVPVIGTAINITGEVTIDPNALEEVGEDLVRWWAPIIALVVLGGLIAISFLICGCCFCSCRVCCKMCGGSLKQKESEYTNCLTITFTVILILFTCGLIVGVVFAFFSNQQVFNTVTELEETVNNTFADVEGFINDGVEKFDFLLCTFNDTIDVGVAQAEALGTTLSDSIDEFSGDVNGLINSAINFSNGIEQALDTLEGVNDTVNSLLNSTEALNKSLNAIADEVDELIANCIALGIPAQECNVVNADDFRNAVQVDFSDVPDIDDVIASVEDVVMGENLTALAVEGIAQFENFTDTITADIQTATDDITSSIDQIRENITSLRSAVTDFTDNVTNEEGVIEEARNTTEDVFDLVRQVDVYRYAFGVIICSLAAVVVVFVLLGVICGIAGFRTDRAPYERTTLSNCGAYSLLCSVFFAVVFGFFLMILSALVFFLGSVSYKFCQDVEGPEYILFVETIDNPDLTGGEYLLSTLIFDDGSIPLTVSGILINCSQNVTVYEALQLENIVDFNELVNVTEQFPDLSGEIDNITAQLNISSDAFISDAVRERLQNFSNSGIAEINITQYQEQINTAILSIDLNMQVELLQNLSDANPLLANETQNIIDLIIAVNESVLAIEAEVDMLAVLVEQLDSDSNELTMLVDNLLNEVDQLVARINEEYIGSVANTVLDTFDDVVDYAQQFVNHVILSIETEVGDCYPVYAIYTGFYNTFCEFAVDGVNGFWLALGWCAIFFIPVAIFAIITSQYYRRMKYNEDLAVPYEDSFPLKTY